MSNAIVTGLCPFCTPKEVLKTVSRIETDIVYSNNPVRTGSVRCPDCGAQGPATPPPEAGLLKENILWNAVIVGWWNRLSQVVRSNATR